MFILIAQISISRRLGGLGCLASARTIENFEQRLITLGLEVIVREEDRGGQDGTCIVPHGIRGPDTCFPMLSFI